MGIGSLTLACLLLAVSAGGASEEWHMNQTQLIIPIHIKPELQTDIRELVLYCSRDEGKTWNSAGVAKPNQEGFLFNTNGDGKYWFNVGRINHKGVQDPVDIYTAPVAQKILIDTVKPEIRVVAERQGEEVSVAWEITEPYPRLESLKVEFHPADASEGVWNAVTVAPGQKRTSFKPNTAATVVVRVQLEDQAGNLGVGQATIPGAATSTPIVQTSPALPPVVTPPLPSSNGSNWNTAQPANPPAGTRAGEGTPTGIQTIAQQESSTAQPLGPAAGTLATSSPLPVRGTLPALQIVNKSQVKLEYEVAKLGPSGVGSVDVYVTTDEGQSWERCPVETAAAVAPNEPHVGAPVRGGVLVSLAKDEVVYGFYMVVKSRAGLGKPAPKSGDLPQIRIERDTTQPVARLLRPLPDPNRRDALLLAWEASDKNLTANPISLEWAANKTGPWQCIGGPELPNTGRFTWTVPAEIPPSVYLRLTVRDTAGNIAVAQTEQPELVDLSVPEVTIIGLGNTLGK